MQNIQLATISPSNRAEGKFTVCAHSDDGQQSADFDCDSERDAIALRGAIRTHAARLRHVTDFRDRPGRAEIARLQAQVDALAGALLEQRRADAYTAGYRHLPDAAEQIAEAQEGAIRMREAALAAAGR